MDLAPSVPIIKVLNVIFCSQMIPENNLEEPDISQVAYELAAQLIRHLDNLEANTSAGITGLVFSLKSSFFPRSLFSQNSNTT